MPKPKCETCPLWEREKMTGTNLGACRERLRVIMGEAGDYESFALTREDDWCRHHPDAPKPIYEAAVSPPGPSDPGWEPVAVCHGPDTYDSRLVLWRRVIGYTKGGEDA